MTDKIVSVNILTLPSDGGSPITDIEYRVNEGAAISLGENTTGSYEITADVDDDVQIRAVNAIGAGDWSDTKVVPEAAPDFELPESTVLAFSIARRLDPDYTGDLIRVRRESDNEEADIGFDGSGNLDEAALLAFTGDQEGDHGYIVTIYEQSGATGAVNLSQATSSLQPRIVQNGAVVKANGAPTALQSGTGETHRWVGAASWATRPSIATAFVCASITSAGRANIGVSLGSSSATRYSLWAQTSSSLTTLANNAGTPSYFANASFVATQGDGTTRGDLWDAFAEKGLVIQRHQSVNFSDGPWAFLQTKLLNNDGLYELSELVICSGTNAGDIASVEENQADFYGITLAED